MFLHLMIHMNTLAVGISSGQFTDILNMMVSIINKINIFCIIYKTIKNFL